jgi:hypothetical protein
VLQKKQVGFWYLVSFFITYLNTFLFFSLAKYSYSRIRP